MDGNKKGYVTHCGGEESCCPVPWISNDECRAREDTRGRKINHSFDEKYAESGS